MRGRSNPPLFYNAEKMKGKEEKNREKKRDRKRTGKEMVENKVAITNIESLGGGA